MYQLLFGRTDKFGNNVMPIKLAMNAGLLLISTGLVGFPMPFVDPQTRPFGDPEAGLAISAVLVLAWLGLFAGILKFNEARNAAKSQRGDTDFAGSGPGQSGSKGKSVKFASEMDEMRARADAAKAPLNPPSAARGINAAQFPSRSNGPPVFGKRR